MRKNIDWLKQRIGMKIILIHKDERFSDVITLYENDIQAMGDQFTQYDYTPEMEQFILYVATISRWIRSCKMQEQIDVCRTTVDEMIIKKFRNNRSEKQEPLKGIDATYYLQVQVDMKELIDRQEKIICSH